MFARLRIAALSALVGLGTLAGIPASAQADNLYLNYGGSHGSVGFEFGDYDRVDYRMHHRRDRWDRDYRGCTPNRAVDKARYYGVHRARVVDVGRRTITVSGYKWGERVRMTFGQAPNCPILRR